MEQGTVYGLAVPIYRRQYLLSTAVQAFLGASARSLLGGVSARVESELVRVQLPAVVSSNHSNLAGGEARFLMRRLPPGARECLCC